MVVYATGYLTSFPFLNTPENAGRRAYPAAYDADVRQIWKSDDPTVGFIGFVRPGFGAIPPLSELQAMLWTMKLLDRVPGPLLRDDEWHYRIIHQPDARITYGVEHDSYTYQLAKDMDIAPSFTEILKLAFTTTRPWRLPWLWAAGACFNTKFRLRGVWKWEGAKDVMMGELYTTISRRHGMFGKLAWLCWWSCRGFILTCCRKHPARRPAADIPGIRQPVLHPIRRVLGRTR